MSIWQDIWRDLETAVYEPLRYFVDPDERVYYRYLLSALVCAVVVYLIARKRRDPEAPGNFLSYLFPRRIYFHPSARADYKFFLIDRVLSFLLVPLFVIGSLLIADQVYYGLDAVFGPATVAILKPGFSTTLVITLTNVLVIDLSLWWIHWLHHRLPILWEFHKVHHSAEVMTPITAYRMHPVEIILNFNLTNLLGGAMLGTFHYLTAGGVVTFQLLGVNIVTLLFYVVGFNLRHSHIPMAYPRWLSFIFVSPWMHQVHHSQESRHIDKNMGFIFSFWDWAFRTLYIPTRGETFRIGLDSGEAPKFHNVVALYLRPFRNIAARFSEQAAVRSQQKLP